MNTHSDLWSKLEDPEYRKAFVTSQINIGIPFQIKAMMKGRGWTQEKLAEKTGMRQPSVSGLMSPGKTRPNIETLRRLAEAFDCGLAVRFVPFSELVNWSDQFDPETFAISDFHEDRAQAEEIKGERECPRNVPQSASQEMWVREPKLEINPQLDLPSLTYSAVEQKIVSIESSWLFAVEKRDMDIARSASDQTEMQMGFQKEGVRRGA